MAETGASDHVVSITVLPNGVVRVSWRAGSCITGPLAADAMAQVDGLNGDQPTPVLVDMAGTETLTREAREQFGRPCTASRIALLGSSPVDRVRANISLLPPGIGYRVPTRFFTSETSALSWLLNDHIRSA